MVRLGSRRDALAVTTLAGEVARAYSATGAAWDDGPARLYGRLAAELVARSPIPLGGRRVLDLGAGTGAAGRAVAAVGGRVVALDAAFGMLAPGARRRPPAVVGDALALPLADGAVDAVVAACSLNHLPDPVAGLREARRVLAPDGAVLASAYALDDSHPARDAVEQAATDHGWSRPGWYAHVKADAVPRLATPARAEAAGRAAGLRGVRAGPVRVPFPELGAGDLVAWRLGMAHVAPFVAGLSRAELEDLVDDALARLGPEPPPLVRSMVVLVGRA